MSAPDAVARHHQATFNERDRVADQDDRDQGRRPEFQSPVPGKSHEDVGGNEKADGHEGHGHGKLLARDATP